MIALQSKHHAGKQAGDQNDDDGAGTDEVDLPDNGVGGVGRLQDIDQCGGKKNAHPAPSLEQIQEFRTDFLDHIAHSPWISWACQGWSVILADAGPEPAVMLPDLRQRLCTW